MYREELNIHLHDLLAASPLVPVSSSSLKLVSCPSFFLEQWQAHSILYLPSPIEWHHPTFHPFCLIKLGWVPRLSGVQFSLYKVIGSCVPAIPSMHWSSWQLSEAVCLKKPCFPLTIFSFLGPKGCMSYRLQRILFRYILGFSLFHLITLDKFIDKFDRSFSEAHPTESAGRHISSP